MKASTLHEKLLELYVKRDNPDFSSMKRTVENYLRGKYPDAKVKRLIDEMNARYDLKAEAEKVRSRNYLTSYIDSIIVGKIRDSYKMSRPLEIDDLEENEFKSLMKQVILNFGYEILYVPANSFDSNIDIILHRGDVKLAVLAIKNPPGYNAASKSVRQAKQIAGYYHCERVIIVSSTGFDDEAVNEAEKLDVTLLDKSKLLPLVQDLIDNRQREEKEYLVSGTAEGSNTVFLEGQVKFPKTKVQVVFVRYFIDSARESLVFEGELLNTGKRPVVNMEVNIRIFDRSGNCVCQKSVQSDPDKFDSREKGVFRTEFDEIHPDDWKNICRYELKLEYSNAYISQSAAIG